MALISLIYLFSGCSFLSQQLVGLFFIDEHLALTLIMARFFLPRQASRAKAMSWEELQAVKRQKLEAVEQEARQSIKINDINAMARAFVVFLFVDLKALNALVASTVSQSAIFHFQSKMTSFTSASP